MLTRYDEYPVHQAVRPFSEIPSTDYAWSDGYYFALYNAELKIKLFWNMRVHANTDILYGFTGIAYEDRQRTLRFSRAWRPNCDTVLGPYSFDFIESFKNIRLKLDANESGYSYDINWLGVAPPIEEDRRLHSVNGRRVTDQVRYVQEGTGTGWLEIDGKRYEISPENGWSGFRDHSWGLYFETQPLKPDNKWFPPQKRTRSFDPTSHLEPGKLAFMTWNNFRTETFSGAYWVYEDINGVRHPVWDATQAMQLGGVVDYGWEGPRVHIVDIQHDYRFVPGTRRFAGGTTTLTDQNGGTWVNEYEVGGAPWLFAPCGPWPGAWKDGGNWQTYHGPGVSFEWDEIDIAVQPLDYHQAPHLPAMKKVLGTEYECKLRVTDPTGKVHQGIGHVETMSFGDYTRYGFSSDTDPASGGGEGPFEG